MSARVARDPQQIQRPTTSYWQKTFLLFIVLAGLLAYWNSFEGVFLLDDDHAIVNNPAIRSLWPPWAYLSLTRPLVYLTLAVNYAWSGLEVWSYHLVNIAIHLLAGLTLFGLLRRTFLTERLKDRFGSHAAGLAFASSLLWIVHPLQTQSVTYVIQRAESLMGLLYLFTLYSVSRSTTSKAWQWIAVFACALGMATKEVMVTAPLLSLLYDRILLSSSFRELFKKRLLLYLGLLATWGILGATYLHQSPSEVARAVGFHRISSLDYVLTQPGVILHYLKLSFWPNPLCLDYLWPVAKSPHEMLPGLLAISGLVVVTLTAFRQRPELGFLGAWFFLILSLTSSFLPIRDVAVEHRMYLPLVSVIVLIVTGTYAGLHRLQIYGYKQSLVSCGMVLIAAIILGTLTISRNEDYKSEVGIWRDTVAKRPQNFRAHYNLGEALGKRGKINEAIQHYRDALHINPNYIDALSNLGAALASQGKLAEAMSHYLKALRVDPDYAPAHNNLGVALAQQGKFLEAVSHFDEALRINPFDADAHNNLGNVLAEQGKLDEATHHYEETLRINPSFVNAHNNLGVALTRQKKTEQAIPHFKKAISLDPDSPQVPNIYFNLADAFATQGDEEEAAKYYSRALQLKPDYEKARQKLETLSERSQATTMTEPLATPTGNQ